MIVTHRKPPVERSFCAARCILGVTAVIGVSALNSRLQGVFCRGETSGCVSFPLSEGMIAFM